MDDQNLKDLEREQADNQLIGDAFQHLLDTYLSSRHRKKVDIVTKAFNFARQAHKGVRRLSGEPYHAPYRRGSDSLRGDGARLNEHLCRTAS